MNNTPQLLHCRVGQKIKKSYTNRGGCQMGRGIPNVGETIMLLYTVAAGRITAAILFEKLKKAIPAQQLQVQNGEQVSL